MVNYIKQNVFNSPINILKSQINYDNNKTVTNFAYVEIEKPRIYIYNTHQGETYSKTACGFVIEFVDIILLKKFFFTVRKVIHNFSHTFFSIH